jgi:hypothetical protein
LIYGVTQLATDFTEQDSSGWLVRLLKTVLFLVPRANPDNEKLYPRVASWALELSDDGWPQREVGLDAHGTPLFCAPDDRNTGFWPDMANRQFAPSEIEAMTGEAFSDLWTRARARA